ncbi:disease resistance protein RPS4-like [Durio zibethinus]|uniref:Disease resistance protein RPS4-like n=1 Tax=Durio zibethinus TaxID=66656 RepID=A0A6P6A578_DURZI|nr:disease resistance protein RPS4-like [Durio zibethinus]
MYFGSFNVSLLEELSIGVLAIKFRPEHLVELRLPGSNIEQLWNGMQNLVNLRVIDLNGCKNLLTIPDLSRAINVKRLSVSYCKRLVQLPFMTHMKSLHCNLFASCSANLKKFPELPLHMTCLVLATTAIEELPETTKYLDQLVHLDLSFSQVKHLPSTIWSSLNKLAYLNMSGTRIQNLPSTILKSDALETIYLSYCPNITRFPNVPENIKYLYLANIPIEEVPSSAERLKNLHELRMTNCKRLKNFSASILDDIRNLSVRSGFCNLGSLTTLDVSESNIMEIPVSIKQLYNLYYLYLRDCKCLKSLIELPPLLLQLDAHGCTSLERVSITQQFRHTFCEDNVRFDKMRFANCFNLYRDAVDNILANALLKIHCMAKERAKGCYEGAIHHYLDIVVAWSKTSERFEYQSTNSSITIKLSPDCKSDRILGFAPCVVVDCDNNHENMDTRIFCKFRLKTKWGDYHNFESEWVSRMYNYGPKCFESNHMIIWFHGSMLQEDKHYEEASFEFYITDECCGNTLEYIKVEKCGVHVFYVDAERCTPGSAFKSSKIFSFK